MAKTILLCAGIFTLTIAVGGALAYLARSGDPSVSTKSTRPGQPRQAAAATRTIRIAVTGMTCDNDKCATAVRNALGGVQGVRAVQVDSGSKQAFVTVDGNFKSEGALLAALKQADFGGQILP